MNTAHTRIKDDYRLILTYTSAHLAGLNHTIDLAESHDIAAVNMSFGGEPLTGTCNATPIKSATDTLRNLGIAVVAAAGNDGEVGQMKTRLASVV